MDHYTTLGLRATCTTTEVRAAYRRLAQVHHPDRGGDPRSFVDLTEAYRVLGDEVSRREYDRVAGARRSKAAAGEDLADEVVLLPREVVLGTTRALRTEGRTVKVRIPPGMKEGQLLRIPGGGVRGRHGAPDGALVLRVRMEKDSAFGRVGDDVLTILGVPPSLLILGGEVDVPLVEGGVATTSVAPRTPTGSALRLPGRGVVTSQGRGDQIVRLEMEVPDDLAPQTIRLLETLRERGL